jgi:hypothetical protein
VRRCGEEKGKGKMMDLDQELAGVTRIGGFGVFRDSYGRIERIGGWGVFRDNSGRITRIGGFGIFYD